MVDEITAGFEGTAEETVESTHKVSRAIASLFRVLVLPRSTFARVAEEGLVVWPAALGFIALAALAKGALAVALPTRVHASGVLSAIAIRYSMALLGPLAFAAAVAGILRLVQRWWHGDATFSTLLSVTSLALVPLALRDIGQAVYMAITHEALLHPGLAALVAPPTHSVLRTAAYASLGMVDAYALWAFVLLTAAVAVTNGQGWVRRTIAVMFTAILCAAIGALPSIAVAGLLAR